MKTTQNLALRAEMAVASGATSLNGPLSGITMTWLGLGLVLGLGLGLGSGLGSG